MENSLRNFSAEYTALHANWLYSIRSFAGLAPNLPGRFPNQGVRIRFAKGSLRLPKELNVWFIDDDPINNILNRSLMEDHFPGVKLAIFQDARKALHDLEHLKILVPDLIFLDLNMPGFNGWDFMEVFAQRSYTAKVFILTSSIDPNDRKAADYMRNVSGFYTKPLLPEMLKDAISKSTVQ